MKNINKMRKILRIVIILLIVIISIYALFIIIPNNEKKHEMEQVEKIRFEYTLYDRDSKLYKEVFNKLKLELEEESINYQNYAEYISKLFIIDLYTLNNKNHKEDIGGVQFVMSEIKENFILNASNTMYKYLDEKNIKLPEVSSINLKDINTSKYTIKEKEYESYEVSLNWEYKEDLGYDNEGVVYLVKDNDKLFVVEKK